MLTYFGVYYLVLLISGVLVFLACNRVLFDLICPSLNKKIYCTTITYRISL